MMQVLSMATHENLIEIALKVFQVRQFSEISNLKIGKTHPRTSLARAVHNPKPN